MPIGHNIKGGSNGHFNHANPIKGQRFFSLWYESFKCIGMHTWTKNVKLNMRIHIKLTRSGVKEHIIMTVRIFMYALESRGAIGGHCEIN